MGLVEDSKCVYLQNAAQTPKIIKKKKKDKKKIKKFKFKHELELELDSFVK
jgi:hypothetical protein